jgi:NAD(P)-dependent dehydrogenase (short-subunit alcohol dehydrogenase family)
MGLLQEKRALVTGGTTGLGLAIAARFLQEGAQIAITGRDRDLGDRAVRELGHQARFFAADAAEPDAVASSVTAATEHLGGLDVLVNNAGVGVAARLIDTPLADYDQVMNVNVRGYLLYAQHAYPHLARSRGCMIHIASDAGIWGEQATGLYSVTKAAVVMLGKMLALDGGPDGVRSNVLCPGDIWPGMRHMAPPRTRPGRKRRRLAGTACRPDRRGSRRGGRRGVLRQRRGRLHYRDHAAGRRRHDGRPSAAGAQLVGRWRSLKGG